MVASETLTLTVLFTDIEGSTSLIGQLGEERWVEALAEHRRVLREAFNAHQGTEVDTQGDAFFYVFEHPSDALHAAAQGRDALGSGPIRVRMGLHTARLIRTGDDFAGRELHRAARIAAAGHGGQIVVSSATRDLVEADLVELGEHRLKDFDDPTVLFQLGNDRFPPLKTISNTNLPRPVSSIVGRDLERQEVLALLHEGARLVTLVGPGGTGKTRLVLEVASELVPAYKAGVFWVGLAALRDPTLVTETIAQTLGAKTGLAEHIAERELLLVLDNVEQVIDAAPEVARLLEACRNLKVLVTSRELLRIAGEMPYAVPPLVESDAVRLFCERSRLEPDEAIGQLCRRLDNLPLAVELAAARARVLTPAQILDRLDQRLDLFTGGRDADPRQATLRATIEWSYELLTATEQRLFAGLAVFAGGCTLEAIEEVAGGDIDTLQSLVDKSLVRRTAGRFWMLETIGELAHERLGSSGEIYELGRMHVDWFLALAERAALFLSGPDQAKWLQRLEDDHENLRATLEWLFAHDEAELAEALAVRLWPFWYAHGHLTEARRWLRRALDAAPDEPSETRANALMAAGYLASDQGDDEEALRMLEPALAWAKEAEAIEVAANAAAMYAAVLIDPRAARAAGEEAVALARKAGDDFILAIALNNLGQAARALDQRDQATAYQEESLALRRKLGDKSRIAVALCNVAISAIERGEVSRATSLIAEAEETARQIDDKRGICLALNGLGWIAYVERRWTEASVWMRESVRIAADIWVKAAVVDGLFALAGIAAATGDAGRAARLAGTAEAHSSPFDGGTFHLADIEKAKAGCDAEAWERAWAEGRAMSLADAAEYALS